MLNTLNRSIGKSAVGPVLPIWLIFVSLFGKCAAQGVSLGFIIPLTLIHLRLLDSYSAAVSG